MSAQATSGPGFYAARPPSADWAQVPLRGVAERLGYVLFALFIFFTCFTFLKPSPYDFTAIPTMIVWAVLGLSLHRAAIPFLFLIVLYHVGLILALVPYFDEDDPTLWTYQSLYLMITAIFFVMFFTQETRRRVTLAVDAYVASCVFASVCGIVSYFVPENGILFNMDGRAAGVFQDPNVLGSFLTVGALALIRRLLCGDARRPLLAGAALALILAALFFAFSRGAWGATAIGTLVTIAMAYRTSSRTVRRRITLLVGAGGFVVAGGIGALMLDEDISKTFADRFTLTKDYDEGVTGRFGNQIRSLPMLLERPNGFGPLRYRLQFDLDPHNSYIGGFANGGWLGGFAFLGLSILTIVVGVRLCFATSPYRDLAQTVVPATLMFFLQAMQIDIDHWRHVYLMLGLVWGLECARQRWLRQPRRPTLADAPAAGRGMRRKSQQESAADPLIST